MSKKNIEIKNTINIPKISITFCIASFLSCILLLSRFFYSLSAWYLFLIWNLFLAWIPLLLSFLIYTLYVKKVNKFVLFIPGVMWLLFFPNAPYIITDFIHLVPRSGVPIWFDAILILSFAMVGLLIGFMSLYILQIIIMRELNKFYSWAFVIIISLLSSFGIYLGRFLRWNSWDIITSPQGLFYDITHRLIYPTDHPKTYAVSLLFFTFFMVIYLVLFSITNQNKNKDKG